MVAREYRGSGGLRLHLDEPLSDEMAKQVTKGHLVPVDGDAPEPEAAEPASPAEKPAAAAKVADWRAYAVGLGMATEDAELATKSDLQDWVQVHEDANSDGSQV